MYTFSNEEAAILKRNSFHERDMDKHKFGLFYCICGKNCSDEEGLRGHIAYTKGELKFPCKFCEKGFPFRSVLARHLERSHKIKTEVAEETTSTSGVKPKSRCTKCGKDFNTRAKLLEHNKLFQ